MVRRAALDETRPLARIVRGRSRAARGAASTRGRPCIPRMPPSCSVPVIARRGRWPLRAATRSRARRPRAVAEIAEGLPVSRQAVSQHLRVLKEARLVSDRAEGTRRIYAVDVAGLVALRADLDRFWAEALSAFKAAVENVDHTRRRRHARGARAPPARALRRQGRRDEGHLRLGGRLEGPARQVRGARRGRCAMKLHTGAHTPNGKRVRICAAECGMPLDMALLDFQKGENRSPGSRPRWPIRCAGRYAALAVLLLLPRRSVLHHARRRAPHQGAYWCARRRGAVRIGRAVAGAFRARPRAAARRARARDRSLRTRRHRARLHVGALPAAPLRPLGVPEPARMAGASASARELARGDAPAWSTCIVMASHRAGPRPEAGKGPARAVRCARRQLQPIELPQFRHL